MDKFIKALKDRANILNDKKTVVCVLLCLILLYGFSVRFLGIRTGDYWDEPQSVSTALQILKTGDFNPHFFHYPAFTIYSCFIIDIFHYYYLMGREKSDFDYLRSLKDIQTEYDTGYHWELSHPSFLHWNRAFICVLGTICILLTYFITRDLYGRVAGIIAALLIAGFPFHIAHSRYVLPNLPLGFFILLVLVFALKFNRSGKLSDLIFSVIFVGCAVASKYPAIVAILIPCVAYLLNIDQLKKSERILAPILIVILPVVVFLLINPFVLFDFSTFLEHSGSQVVHYKVLGHFTSTSEPGSEHFLFQMGLFKNNISGLLFYCALLGIFISTKRKKEFLITITFPLVYMYYMCHQKANMHRNYVVMYPFLAIYSAITIVFLSECLSRIGQFLQKKIFSNIRNFRYYFYSIPIILLLIILFPRYVHEFKASVKIWKTPETRTRAIEYINSLVHSIRSKKIKVGIARDLRIHRLDLRKLKTDFFIFDHKDINEAVKICDFLIVGEYMSYDKGYHTLENLLNSLTPRDLVFCVIDGDPHRRDIFSWNPKILILRGLKSTYIPKSSISFIELPVYNYSGELANVKSGNKWGYIDRFGRWVIKPQFDYACPFYSGLTVVKIRGKWGYINTKGSLISKPEYDYASYYFPEGLALIKLSGKWGYFSKRGGVAIKPQFDDAMTFSEGLASVKIGDKWGYIDRRGKVVIKPQFSYAYPFYNDFAIVKVKKWKVVSDPTRRTNKPLYEGLPVVVLSDQWGYIDKGGNFVGEPRFDYAGYFFTGKLAPVEINGMWAYVNKVANFFVSPRFEEAWSFSKDLARIKINGKYGYLNRQGILTIKHQYDWATPFEGTPPEALVKFKNKYFYIDEKGDKVRDCNDFN